MHIDFFIRKLKDELNRKDFIDLRHLINLKDILNNNRINKINDRIFLTKNIIRNELKERVYDYFEKNNKISIIKNKTIKKLFKQKRRRQNKKEKILEIREIFFLKYQKSINNEYKRFKGY